MNSKITKVQSVFQKVRDFLFWNMEFSKFLIENINVSNDFHISYYPENSLPINTHIALLDVLPIFLLDMVV